jgi:hypothetical protein
MASQLSTRVAGIALAASLLLTCAAKQPTDRGQLHENPASPAGSARERKPAQKGRSNLQPEFRAIFGGSLETSAVHQEITPLATPLVPLARAPVQGAPWAIRAGINNALNGRIPLRLDPTRKPRLEFRSELPPGLFRSDVPAGQESVSLLTGPDRVVASASVSWILFDSSGKTLASEMAAGSLLGLNDEATRLIVERWKGGLFIRRLSDGGMELVAEASGGSGERRWFVHAQGNELTQVSRHEDPDLHRAPRERTSIEVLDLNYRDQGPAPIAAVEREAGLGAVALAGRRMVLAMVDRLYFFEPDLKVHRIWDGSFRSFGLSLDEAGNVYLLNSCEQSFRLWKITPEARRTWVVPLERFRLWPVQPPLIGYDHNVYLILRQQILAISQDGQMLWQKAGSGPLAGAFVTANDLLVTSEGSQVAVWNAAGERELLFDTGEPLVSAPVITAGHLFVASTNHLFGLSL